MKDKIIVLSLCLMILSACSIAPQEMRRMETPSKTADVVQSLVPSMTETPRPTYTVTPVPPSNTSTATPSLLPTPLPKLSKADSLAKVLELLKSNGDCSLPCWWGIVPGETNMKSAMNNLLSFSTYNMTNYPKGKIKAEYLFEVPKSVSSIELVSIVFLSEGETVDRIGVWDLVSWKYQMPNMLQTQGVPTSIWVQTFKKDSGLAENTVPFSLALFYQDKGILAMYGNLQGQVHGSTVRGCITESPLLFLWSPADKLEFDDISQWRAEDLPYLNLVDASGISSENFYAMYKNGDKLVCINTSADLWTEQ